MSIKVKCCHCGRECEVDGKAYLRSGWPECCGETMGLVSSAEVAEQLGYAAGQLAVEAFRKDMK